MNKFEAEVTVTNFNLFYFPSCTPESSILCWNIPLQPSKKNNKTAHSEGAKPHPFQEKFFPHSIRSELFFSTRHAWKFKLCYARKAVTQVVYEQDSELAVKETVNLGKNIYSLDLTALRYFPGTF